MQIKRTIYDSNLPNRAVAVYIYLCDRSNKEGISFPAIGRIAADIHYSKTTIKTALRELEKAGYIKKKYRFRLNGGKSSNEYEIL